MRQSSLNKALDVLYLRKISFLGFNEMDEIEKYD